MMNGEVASVARAVAVFPVIAGPSAYLIKRRDRNVPEVGQVPLIPSLESLLR